MEAVPVKIVPRDFGETRRRDWWWVEPMIVFTVFGSFIVYATWAAFQNANYTYGPYLSPFYSPILFTDDPDIHAWFGMKASWWPGFAPFSPAPLILPCPGPLRLTCYYYRGAYYKAFWQDPVSCSVGQPRKGYLGEKYFPLILQNIHRYFMYVAVIFIVILTKDAIEATRFQVPGGVIGDTEFGIGVGTL